MTCDSCKTAYKIGIEWEGPRRTKHLCFRCGGKYIPTVLEAMKTNAIHKIVDNFSSKVKSMLGLLLLGISLGGCQSIPIIDKMNAPSPRVERFYQELQLAKEYRATHSATPSPSRSLVNSR